jgi:hypothetical protein
MSRSLRTLLGVVIVASIAGVLHLYGTYRVNRDLEQVMASVRVTHLAISPLAGDQQRSLRVHLEVENPTPDPAEVAVSPVGITANEDFIGFAHWTGQSEATVKAGAATRFEGQTLMWESTYEGLKAENQIDYHLSGEMTVSDEFLWVSKTVCQSFDLDLRGMVD